MNKYYKRYLILFIIGIVANVVVDYVQLFIPEYLGDMVDIVSLNTNVIFDDIKKIVYSLIIVAFTLFIGRIIMRFTILVASAKIDRDIRHDMFLKTERLSQRYFHENKVGRALCKRHNGVPEGVDYSVHLPIAEPLAVSLFGTLMDTCAVGDIGGFCGA